MRIKKNDSRKNVQICNNHGCANKKFVKNFNIKREDGSFLLVKDFVMEFEVPNKIGKKIKKGNTSRGTSSLQRHIIEMEILKKALLHNNKDWQNSRRNNEKI